MCSDLCVGWDTGTSPTLPSAGQLTDFECATPHEATQFTGCYFSPHFSSLPSEAQWKGITDSGPHDELQSLQGELSLWEPLQEPQSGSVEQGLSQMDQQDHLVTFDRQIQAEHLAHARCSCGHIK